MNVCKYGIHFWGNGEYRGYKIRYCKHCTETQINQGGYWVSVEGDPRTIIDTIKKQEHNYKHGI